MKNKGLIITLIVLLSIIIFLLVLFLIACLNGGIGLNVGFINLGSKSSTIIFDEKYEAQNITNIEVSQEAGDITFEETKENNIRVVVYGQNENDIEVSLNNDKLKVDYTNANQGFWIFNFGSTKNDITIYIPSHYSNNIQIKNNYGNSKIASLENATVNIDSDAGNVELDKIKNATIKCDYGNIEINAVLNKCDIKADCGNVEIQEMQIKENSSIKADLGNVTVGDINDVYIDADVDLGKSKISKNNRNSQVTLKVNCDLGNVNVGQ